MIEHVNYTHETSFRRKTLPPPLPPSRDDNRPSRVDAMPPNKDGEGSRLPTTVKHLQTYSENFPYLVLLRRSFTPSAAPNDANAPAMLFPMPLKSLNENAGSRLPTTISNCKRHPLALHSPSVVQNLAHPKRSSSTAHATEDSIAENLSDSIVRLEVIQ